MKTLSKFFHFWEGREVLQKKETSLRSACGSWHLGLVFREKVPCFPLVNNQPQLSIVLHYSYRLDEVKLSVGNHFSQKKQECLNWINSLIFHNSSGHAFSSLLSIFPYAMMEMEYLGSAEFSNYGTNCFHTGGTTSGATTPTVWKIS